MHLQVCPKVLKVNPPSDNNGKKKNLGACSLALNTRKEKVRKKQLMDKSLAQAKQFEWLMQME